MSDNISSINEDYKSIINSLETSFMMAVLKYCTDYDHPLSAGEIASAMSHITHKSEYYDTNASGHSPKTILRKLRYIISLLDDNLDEYADTRNAFILTYGGYVCCNSSLADFSSRAQQKFYFEPLLNKNDLSTIYGAVASNRYISTKDAESIQQTLHLLSPKELVNPAHTRGIGGNSGLPKAPENSASRHIGYINLFTNVHSLYDAIKNKQQIEIEYGQYTLNKETSMEKIQFQTIDKELPYVVNPYALFWHNGEYYLFCIPFMTDTVVTLRVDHVINIKPFVVCDNIEPCAPIPDYLKKYFNYTADGSITFDSKKYISTHPLLTFSEDENLINCVLECDKSALSLIVDTFGSAEILDKEILIKESLLTPNSTVTPSFAVRIPNVQIDDILQFCIKNHLYVTAISPDDLVLMVWKALSSSLSRYSQLTSKSIFKQEKVNPFKK